MKIDKYIDKITSCVLFNNFSSDDVLKLISDSKLLIRSNKTGDYLMRTNSNDHFIGILIKGTAAVERKSDDGLMHMSSLKSGDLFGAASVFSSDQLYVVDIRCLTDCKMLCIPEEQLIVWFQNDSKVLKNYLCYLNGRIRFLNHRLDALSKNSVSSKLMCHFISESRNGLYEVKSYTELANMLCLSRATMYRALDSLCEEGKISRNGKIIKILEEI